MSQYAPPHVLVEFPPPHFPATFTTVKVIPTPGTKLIHAAQFFNSLHSLRYPLAFEFISTPESAYFQLAFAPEESDVITQQLQTHFPQFNVIPIDAPEPPPAAMHALSLIPHPFRVLKNFTQSATDPYQQLFYLLDRNMHAHSSMQLLISPISYEEYQHKINYLQSYKLPAERFHQLPEIQALKRQKRSLLQYMAESTQEAIRRGEAFVSSKDKSEGEIRVEKKMRADVREADKLDTQINQLIEQETRAVQSIINERIKWLSDKHPAWLASIELYSTDTELLAAIQNRFIGQYETFPRFWQPATIHQTFSISRHKVFSDAWSVLSTEELAALAHFPGNSAAFDRLEMASMKSTLPPESFTTGEVQIGVSTARGQTKSVSLPDSVRARHLYVVGKSGSGKSTLITNIALQDIERGEGVCVIDPHGDLVSDLLDHIPENRVKDVIYFNVSDRQHPIGLDMLNAKNEAEIELLTDDLITTFKRLTETWGERMETILRYSFNTLLRTPGATFLDLQKLLTNEGWRSTIVRKIDFAPLTEFWFDNFANMPKDATQPILSRMTKIVLSPTLNAIFGQSASRLNFNDVIRNRKILLINLGGDSRDRNNEQLSVSNEMKKLIGSVVVSQLQLAAMRQASIPEHDRVPCRFFVDEFQNFVSGAFPMILSEARKYKLCLTVAHQYISQLDEATRNAVFGNVGTMIVMPLGQKDAQFLGAELGSYTPGDVANLAAERHEALCRPTTMAADTFLFTTLPPKPKTRSFAHEIIAHTRQQYSAEPEIQAAAAAEQTGISPADLPHQRKPMRATPKQFASASEKILHFVSQAHYLTNSQIIELCYPHLSEASKRPAASRDLKKLTDSKKLKSINWGDGKVFYTSSQCNPTAHNLAVRDLLIKIWQSDYEIAEVNLSVAIGALSPDLLVTFLCEDGSLLPTYWEYDTGTEGITELIKKIARYVPHSSSARISFVCSTKERMQAIMKATKEEFIEYSVLDEFTSLAAPVFVSRSHIDRYSFF